MPAEDPDHPPGQQRPGHRPVVRGGGLVVVDEAQNRADAAAFMQSQTLLQAGRTDDAEAVLRALAAMPTTTVRAHAAVVLAALLVGSERAGDAVAVLGAIPATGVAVDVGVVHMIRAQALRRLGRHDEAVGAAASALALASTVERCLVLASAWLSAGRAVEAAAVLREGVARAPDDTGLLGQYAGALVLAGDDVGARTAVAALDALQADDDPEWHRQRAWVAACRGDSDAGQAALDRALALDAPGTKAFFDDDDLMARAGLRI